MSKLKTYLIPIGIILAGVFITLLIGTFAKKEKIFTDYDSRSKSNICLSAMPDPVIETKYGLPLSYLEYKGNNCYTDEAKWSIVRLLGDVLIWSAAVSALYLGVRKKYA